MGRKIENGKIEILEGRKEARKEGRKVGRKDGWKRELRGRTKIREKREGRKLIK